MTASWLARNRTHLWRIGVEHRETLMAEYMARHRLTERPLVHMVTDELIEDIQDVRILKAPLPMDRYAQTEVVRGRPVITVNSLIWRMLGVKDDLGVAQDAVWHESIHIPVDVERRDLPPLTDLRSGLEGSTSSPLLCSASPGGEHRWSLPEQAIEAAALAAAVADADLRRCELYLRFLALAAGGGDLGGQGWHLLQLISNAIGVNRTALRRYFEQHGICRLVGADRGARLIGIPQPFGGFKCLEPESARIRSVA